MEVYKSSKGDISKLRIGGLNIYNEKADCEYLKNMIDKLFCTGDRIFFFFRREEDLTDEEEMIRLRKEVFKKIDGSGKLVYLRKVDQRRFDAIATLDYDADTSTFIIDLWKYFYACYFFKPVNTLTFDDYQDYLAINGVDDLYGRKMLMNKLCDFICIKGLGGEEIIISHQNTLEMDF